MLMQGTLLRGMIVPEISRRTLRSKGGGSWDERA